MAIAPLGNSMTGLMPAGMAAGSPAKEGELPFTSIIKRMLGEANAQQTQADNAVEKLANGEADSLHRVMLSVAKADLSFRLLLEVRNRVAEAFQEIMRMQI